MSALPATLAVQQNYVDSTPAVLQYRQAFYEARGRIPMWPGLPVARVWPAVVGNPGNYRDKLVNRLPMDGKGAEVGALNLPLLTRKDCPSLLYVDHDTTAGIKAKYPHLSGIVDIDRPVVNNSIADTLRGDGPLDFFVASQCFEHVPDFITAMQQIAEVLKAGGVLSISLPDRRFTFDLYREETRTSDLIAAYYAKAKVPDVRAVYDNQSLARAVNVPYLFGDESMTPDRIIAGRGAASPRLITTNHLGLTESAHAGVYHDIHVWVWTGPSFLISMAQLAADGLLPFRCKQFYPTDEASKDRDNSAFVIHLEKLAPDADKAEARLSFLMALGE